MIQQYTLPSAPGPLPVQLAQSLAPGPGVIVLHDGWGPGESDTQACARLALAGFTALAPDLFRARRPRTTGERQKLLLALDLERALGDVEAALAHLRTGNAGAAEAPVAILGFGLGGALALVAATRFPLAGVVTFYGTFDDLAHAEVACPVQGHFAEDDDEQTPDATVACFNGLKQAGKDPEFYLYDGTRHGFAREGSKGAHDAAACNLAWTRALDFLHRHTTSGSGRRAV